MMRCQRMEQQLIPYLDGKLSASQQKSVAAHLERCSHCATALEGLSEICALLDAEREVAVPAEFEGEVIRRIHGLEGARSARRWVVPLATAASAAAIAVLAAWMTLGSFMPGGGAPRTALTALPVREPLPLKASQPTMPPPPQVVARRDTPAVSAPVAEAALETVVPEVDLEGGFEDALPMPGPEEVPSDLLEALDMFVYFPIIRDLDRFEHFEAIWTASDAETEDDATTRGG